jgi:hypothetical protein
VRGQGQQVEVQLQQQHSCCITVMAAQCTAVLFTSHTLQHCLSFNQHAAHADRSPCSLRSCPRTACCTCTPAPRCNHLNNPALPLPPSPLLLPEHTTAATSPTGRGTLGQLGVDSPSLPLTIGLSSAALLAVVIGSGVTAYKVSTRKLTPRWVTLHHIAQHLHLHLHCIALHCIALLNGACSKQVDGISTPCAQPCNAHWIAHSTRRHGTPHPAHPRQAPHHSTSIYLCTAPLLCSLTLCPDTLA